MGREMDERRFVTLWAVSILVWVGTAGWMAGRVNDILDEMTY